MYNIIIIPLISDRFGRLLRNCSVRKAIHFFIKLKCFFIENLEHFVLYFVNLKKPRTMGGFGFLFASVNCARNLKSKKISLHFWTN